MQKRPKRVHGSNPPPVDKNPLVASPDATLTDRVSRLEAAYDHLPNREDLRESVQQQAVPGLWVQLIKAINTLLGFYVLALLIVEAFLTTLLTLSDLDSGAKTWGMWAGIVLFVLVVAIVSVFAWFKPTHLTYTGFESLLDRGKIPYGTEWGEVAEKDLPSGAAATE